MTQETGISPAVSDRICKHMNDDHGDAIVQYATVYGQCEGVTSAVMDAIDTQGMDITAQVNGQPTSVRVTFDRELTDAKDAHHVLVEMLKAVRSDGGG
ncbi:MAG: DUF2470 domain-containing protein [Oscillatoriales cyanobacterium]|nr:MAG: DUF2470 domain-containing protein [Oscillatoriales cyanobacterium]